MSDKAYIDRSRSQYSCIVVGLTTTVQPVLPDQQVDLPHTGKLLYVGPEKVVKLIVVRPYAI